MFGELVNNGYGAASAPRSLGAKLSAKYPLERN